MWPWCFRARPDSGGAKTTYFNESPWCDVWIYPRHGIFCIHFCINPVTVGQKIITILVGACMNLQDLLVQCFDRTQYINNIHTNEVTRHRSLGLLFGCCLHIVSFCLKCVFVDMQCFLFPPGSWNRPWNLELLSTRPVSTCQRHHGIVTRRSRFLQTNGIFQAILLRDSQRRKIQNSHTNIICGRIPWVIWRRSFPSVRQNYHPVHAWKIGDPRSKAPIFHWTMIIILQP